MCAMVTLQARSKKHCMEHKLCDTFEALRLSWVLKLVSTTSSRRGGTKLVNHAGASGKETRAN
jgi:hypothetical protein